ncbi:MAG: class A beta-lactamase [Proteobacteria bacterium]|nr:class A beta-lactamase [Pseudomonadota bacterium]
MTIFFSRYFILFTAIFFSLLSQAEPISMQAKLAKLEARVGGRIGLTAINTSNNERIEYRADESVPFCSTYKVIDVAAILKKSMEESNFLQQKIVYKKSGLIPYSPVTEKHLEEGMTIADLCQAAITYSDNTAANLLTKKLGGPEKVTAFARSIGDNQFRLDRWEPELNSATPKDLRDTTTPKAMAKSLERLVLGDVLALPQRQLLKTWLIHNTTGNARIRAGTPKGWLVGDKTGTGDYGTTNDIGIIWPPHCSPIVLALFYTQNKNAAPGNEVIATITDMVINEFISKDACIPAIN